MPKKPFRILCRKNLLVEKRCYLRTLLEIISIAAIFLALANIQPEKYEKEVKGHKNIKLDELSEFSKLLSVNVTAIPYKLYFTPKNGTETIFNKTAEKLHLLEAVGFDSEESMIEQFDDTKVLACVILQDHDVILRFPNYFRTRPYTYFYSLNDFWLTRSTAGGDDGKSDFYIREGFLQLLYTIVTTQMEVENNTMASKFPAIISSLFNSTKPTTGCVNAISNKPINPEGFLKWSLWYFMFFVPFINLLWKFSREYEENIFSHHSVYGFHYIIHRFAHFAVSLMHFVVLDIMILIAIAFIWPSFAKGKFLLMLVFLVLYNMLLILYAMVQSNFFKNTKTAVWCAVTLWIFSYAAFLEILYTSHFDILIPKMLIITVLFINNLLPNGLLNYFEEEKSLMEIYILFGAQLLILFCYCYLLVYIDCKCPVFYKKRLRNIRKKSKCDKLCMKLTPKTDESHFEYGPLRGGWLQLKNVYTYCDHLKKNTQLKNISMRFIQNEISVILGPRNSGKSIFIGMLAGWKDHQGRIVYKGHDISENWEHYRQHLDVVIANNALFDYLTIRETLKYFILIKHTTDFQLNEELRKWLHVIKPLANGQKLVKSLTFSEKRILDLCCTLACNTAVVLLDEPTEHMRLEEQMMFWDILKKEKQNRIIIVTTVNLDEANEIGDRIGILNDGCLLAWGSSYFLKSKISSQVFLICFHELKAQIGSITDIMEKYIPDVQVQKYFVDRVIYAIPTNKKPILQRLLIELEKEFSALGITKLYVVGSGLNEVYMSLTSIPIMKAYPPNMKRNLNVVHNQQITLRRRVIKALLYKKVLCQSRNPLPICLIFISFFVLLLFGYISPARFNAKSVTISGNVLLKNYSKIFQVSNVDDIVSGSFHYVTNSSIKGDSNSLAGLEMNDDSSIRVWFNERIFHSAPLALNLAFNYLSHGGTYINKPIVIQSNYDIHIILGTIMPLTMSVVFVQLQDERSSNMLRLQKIGRVSEKSRWIITFLWDYYIYLLVAMLYLIMLVTFIIVKPTLLIIAAALILFILCGLASLLFIYLVYLYLKEDNMSRAFIKIFLLQISLGLLPNVLFTNILIGIPEVLFYIIMLLPGFSVLHGTTKIFDNNQNLDFRSYLQFDNPGILDSVTCMGVIIFIYFTTFVAIIIYRRAYFKSTPAKVKELASVCYPYDDERVVKEKVRISNMSIEACKIQIILVDQLEPALPKKGNRVYTISFGLSNYGCLGIYGSNESGKTHIIKQLVGEEGFWFGEVYIAGYNIKKHTVKALKHVGYCPQNKGFNNLLTPSELLKFFLILYGVRKSSLLEQLTNISMSLQLRGYMNTRIGKLPENIKRRINLAAALIARKKILIFDEPTRGLPAYDRLLMWNILRFCRSMNNTIIFTTSESLELKELADYVVTVNEGEMISYDSPHNLEYYYNIGFYIEIKLYADGLTLEELEENLNMDVENLNRFVRIFHDESELIYRCDCVVKYYIPVENVLYSYIFGVLEKHRHRLNIADYTLGSLSLNGVLRMLRKCRKEKRRFERAPLNVLKDPKTLPRRI